MNIDVPKKNVCVYIFVLDEDFYIYRNVEF